MGKSADRAGGEQDFENFFGSDRVRRDSLQLLASMKRAAVGYALAAVVFIPLGIFMGLFALSLVRGRHRDAAAGAAARGYSRAMLFFGLGDEMKIFVIFFSCAWPILLNTLDGVRNIDRVLLHTARTFGLPQRKIIWQVILPASSPKSSPV